MDQNGPNERRYFPGRSPLLGWHCELQHCSVERPSHYYTDMGPHSRGMPAATSPHSQLPFDTPAQPEAPLFLPPCPMFGALLQSPNQSSIADAATVIWLQSASVRALIWVEDRPVSSRTSLIDPPSQCR